MTSEEDRALLSRGSTTQTEYESGRNQQLDMSELTERENLASVGGMMANSNEAELVRLRVKLAKKKESFTEELNTA